MREENQFPSRFFFSVDELSSQLHTMLSKVFGMRGHDFPSNFCQEFLVFFPALIIRESAFWRRANISAFPFSRNKTEKSLRLLFSWEIFFFFFARLRLGHAPENRPLTENGLPQNKYLKKKVVFFKFLFFNVGSRAFLRILYCVRNERKTNNSKE